MFRCRTPKGSGTKDRRRTSAGAGLRPEPALIERPALLRNVRDHVVPLIEHAPVRAPERRHVKPRMIGGVLGRAPHRAGPPRQASVRHAPGAGVGNDVPEACRQIKGILFVSLHGTAGQARLVFAGLARARPVWARR